MDIHTGFGKYLWAGADSPWHGKFRLGAYLSTSLVINEYELNFSFNPVSFLSFGVKESFIKSDYDEFTYYDCEEIRCKGLIKRKTAFGKMALALGPLFSLFSYQVSNSDYSTGNGLPIAEYTYATATNNDHELLLTRSYVLGYTYESYNYLLVSDHAYFYRSKQYYSLNIAAVQKGIEDWSILLGAGATNSGHINPSATIIVKLKYIFAPSINKF